MAWLKQYPFPKSISNNTPHNPASSFYSSGSRARMLTRYQSHLRMSWMKALAQRTCPLGLDEVDLETWRWTGARMREDPSTSIKRGKTDPQITRNMAVETDHRFLWRKDGSSYPRF